MLLAGCKKLISKKGISVKEIRLCKNGEYLPGGQFYATPLAVKCMCLNLFSAYGVLTLANYNHKIKSLNTLGLTM
jgi:hypothetical protein